MAATTETLEVTCPGCGRQSWIEAVHVGRKVSCPLCQEVIRVPAPGDPAPAKVATAKAARKAPVPAPAPAAPLPAVELPDAMFAPPAAHQRTRGVIAAPQRESTGRDVEAEAHLVAIAIWQRVWCVLGLIFAVFIYKTTVAMAERFGFATPGAVQLVGLPVVGALASGALGHFLARYHAPARLLTVGLAGLTVIATLWDGISILSLLACAFDIAVIVVLLNARSVAVCTPGYRENVARNPDVSVPWASSPFFWIPAVLTLLLVGVALFGALATAALMR